MNGTEKCPKCNSALDPEFRGPWWICGSHEVRGQLVQSFECKHVARANEAERQRDALAARVKRLEEAGDAIVENGSVSERLFNAWTQAKEAK